MSKISSYLTRAPRPKNVRAMRYESTLEAADVISLIPDEYYEYNCASGDSLVFRQDHPKRELLVVDMGYWVVKWDQGLDIITDEEFRRYYKKAGDPEAEYDLYFNANIFQFKITQKPWKESTERNYALIGADSLDTLKGFVRGASIHIKMNCTPDEVDNMSNSLTQSFYSVRCDVEGENNI
jgi:hypothetical protein